MEEKEEGNALFKSGDYMKAAVAYSKGIKRNPEEVHILYSNRSAAFLKMSKITKAIEDADTCIKLQPSWPKGYFRKVMALEARNQTEDVVATIKEGLIHAPNDEELQRLLHKYTKPTTPAIPRPAEPVRTPAVTSEPDANMAEWLGEGEERLVRFVTSTMDDIHKNFADMERPSDVFLRPTAFVLPHDETAERPVIAIDRAFSNPEMHRSCVEFLREEVRGASMIMMAVEKGAMNYPRVWHDREGCTTQADGLFVQLELPSRRYMAFFPIAADRRSLQTGKKLDVDIFQLMPLIFR